MTWKFLWTFIYLNIKIMLFYYYIYLLFKLSDSSVSFSEICVLLKRLARGYKKVKNIHFCWHKGCDDSQPFIVWAIGKHRDKNPHILNQNSSQEE